MKNANLIIFDWSGTISDDRNPVHAANTLLSQHYGVPPILDLQEWLKQTARGPHEYFAERGVTDEHLWEQYQIYLDQVVATGNKPTIYAEATEVLADLKSKGKKLSVISSHPEKNLHLEAKTYGIFDIFENITGDVMDKTRGIKKVLQELTANPIEAMYIGDMVSDIVAAKRVPLPIMALSRGYHSQEMLEAYQPDEIWSDLKPLLNLI